MKPQIHPTYYPDAKVTCATCGRTWTTGSTKKELRVDICSNCHPFFSGEAQRIIDIEGQVDRFYKKLSARQSYVETKKAQEAAKKSPERPIAELGLSARATEALTKAGVTEVSQLLSRLAEGDASVLAIDGFGQKSLIDAKKKLRGLGYELPETAAAANTEEKPAYATRFTNQINSGTLTGRCESICPFCHPPGKSGAPCPTCNHQGTGECMRHTQGSIEVICGSMFSGKTDELIRRLIRAKIAKQKVQVFKPAIDVRYAVEKVTSHAGANFDAIPVEKAADIIGKLDEDTTVIGIDEAQFMDPDVVKVAQELAELGKRVLVAGLDLDFRGEPFGPMPLLMAKAERVDKLHAICMVCGEEASRTQRLVNGSPARYDDPVVIVGAAEMYEARCRLHHEVPR